MEILNVNGTKVVYHYLPSRLTNIQFLTNVGSCAETKDIWGLAHILEHMFFKGSKKYPGPSDIQTAANNIGGKLNAWTWVDQTVYHITVLNDMFYKGFDILADMYQNPLFPEYEFTKEINPILSEYRRGEDDPSNFLASRLVPLMVGDDAGHSTIGTEDTIKAADVSKMHSFRNRYYGGNNTLISIVGGISKDDVVRVVSELFTLPKASSAYVPIKPNYNSGSATFNKKGITEAMYIMMYPALERNHPDRIKQAVMTYILGGNDSGMLFERIREELGMSCYGIFASQTQFDPYGLIEISCGISPNEISKLDVEVRAIINEICSHKITTDRLERAKASLRTSIALASESSAGYNSTISIPILKGETSNPLDKLCSEIEMVNVEDVLVQAQETFKNNPYLGILYPED